MNSTESIDPTFSEISAFCPFLYKVPQQHKHLDQMIQENLGIFNEYLNILDQCRSGNVALFIFTIYSGVLFINC